jgi:hypothetical protein
MALGTYPDMELAEARKAARAKRTLVDAGRDPLLQKQSEIEAQLKSSAAKKARGKFRELAEDWYETEIDGGRLKHPAVPRRYLDKYLLPEFGGTVAADISPAMAARLLARVARKAPTAANDLLRYMRRVFRFVALRIRDAPPWFSGLLHIANRVELVAVCREWFAPTLSSYISDSTARARSRSHRCAVAPGPRAPAILMPWWRVCPDCPGLLLRPL